MFHPGLARHASPRIGWATRARDSANALALAGTLFTVAGVVLLMGIITAEAVYPDTYTTFENEISDLGATRPPDSIIRQPSATIFNLTMMSAGVSILAGALGLFRGIERRRMGIWMLIVGIGVLGVGVFPGNRAPFHGIFAMTAFVAGGGAAIVSGTISKGMFRYIAIGLGTTALLSLVVAMLGDLTPALDELGDGGVERWVAYPTILWLVLFGGYLLNAEAKQERTEVQR